MCVYPLEVALVKDKDGEALAVEFRRGDRLWFFSARQDLWPGVRIGKFPCDGDGTDFERQVVEFAWGSGAADRRRYGDARPEISEDLP